MTLGARLKGPGFVRKVTNEDGRHCLCPLFFRYNRVSDASPPIDAPQQAFVITAIIACPHFADAEEKKAKWR